MRMAKMWVVVLLMPFVSMAKGTIDCMSPPCGDPVAHELNLSYDSSNAFHSWHKSLDRFKDMLVKAGLDEDTAMEAIKVKKEEWMAKKREKLLGILKKVGVDEEKATEVVDRLKDLIKEKREQKAASPATANETMKNIGADDDETANGADDGDKVIDEGDSDEVAIPEGDNNAVIEDNGNSDDGDKVVDDGHSPAGSDLGLIQPAAATAATPKGDEQGE